MQRHQQPVSFVSPAGDEHNGHQQANNDSTKWPTGHQEAYPFVGVSPSAQHHSSLPIMLTCTTAAPGGAATGAREGEGENNAEDDLHDPWHVPYSDSCDDFESPFSHPWPSAALASHILYAEQGALRSDPPPTLPLLTAAPILQLPTSLVIDHIFSPCHGHSASEDCHAMTPMDVNDITITALETLRPVTFIVSGPPCQPWSRAGSRLGWQDHRSQAFAPVIGFIRFYLPDYTARTDIQNYINNINTIELTDPGPGAWDLCLSEFPHFTPVVTTDYFPKFVARPGAYAFRMQTNGQPGAGMVYEHDGLWSWADNGKWCEALAALRASAKGITLEDLPTSPLSGAALRKLIGGVIDLNVMRNYIKAVSGAALAPVVITVCHTSYGSFITNDGEAWVLIDSGASSHVNAHRTDYIYYMDIPATEQFLVGGFGQPAVGIGTTLAPPLDITGTPRTIVARDCYHTPNITSNVGLTNISRLLITHQLNKQGSSFYFSRLLNSMITPDGVIIHLQPYSGTTCMYGVKLLSIHDPSHGHHTCSWALTMTTLMTGRKPNLADLHVFGCVAWVNIPVTMRAAKAKMTPKSWPGIYVGHHEDSAGYRIYNPATRRETVTRDVIFDEVTRPFSSTPALSMPVFRFPDDDHLLDKPQPLDQQEGPQALPPMPPSAALASTQKGPPPPNQDEQYPPCHQEGDATALLTPHSSGSAHLPSSYVDIGDYHPTLVASAIAEVVRPYPAQMAALALPAPTVRASKAPRNYKEAISSNHPDDWKQSMDREIASITKMETFVLISVPELRRDNPAAIIIQMAWPFAEKHDKDGNLIKRKARVVVRGDQLTVGENYDDTNTYAPVVSFIALRTYIALAIQLDWEMYQFDVTCAFFNANLDEEIYMAFPTERHWQIAVSVLRYLKGTPSHGLSFRKQLDNEAHDFLFFVDADWATFMPKRRSTTGYFALVHGTPVAYRAHVQKSVALTTAEAEFVSLCMACKCLAFIRVLLRQLNHPPLTRYGYASTIKRASFR
eukprot:jgi/Tetstr1/448148/TSEL_035441.t1